MSTAPKTCADCGKTLGYRNRSGLCAKHNGQRRAAALMADPETRAKVGKTRRLMYLAYPEKREATARQLAAARELRTNPGANLARDRLWEQGNAIRPAGSEARMRAGRRVSATRYAWCPPELRDTARFLLREKRLTLAETQAIIAEEHAVAMRRWLRTVQA